MKICVPSETGEDLSAKVCAHFGSAPYFTIYDTDKESSEIINNTNAHHAHGICHPMKTLGTKGINAVVCSGMGSRAILGLNASGIKAYRSAHGTVAQVIEQFQKGKLEEMTPENACSQHSCH